jgi:hypothetical protein
MFLAKSGFKYANWKGFSICNFIPYLSEPFPTATSYRFSCSATLACNIKGFIFLTSSKERQKGQPARIQYLTCHNAFEASKKLFCFRRAIQKKQAHSEHRV